MDWSELAPYLNELDSALEALDVLAGINLEEEPDAARRLTVLMGVNACYVRKARRVVALLTQAARGKEEGPYA
jgi:hypothetical protein